MARSRTAAIAGRRTAASPGSARARAAARRQDRPARPVGSTARWVTPGLIDCHTHLVFGGDRVGEFEQRLNGATYEEIARAGGGIVSTVTRDPGGVGGRAATPQPLRAAGAG